MSAPPQCEDTSGESQKDVSTPEGFSVFVLSPSQLNDKGLEAKVKDEEPDNTSEAPVLSTLGKTIQDEGISKTVRRSRAMDEATTSAGDADLEMSRAIDELKEKLRFLPKRRSFCKVHKVSWNIAIESKGYVKCLFQNCNYLALTVEEMMQHYGICSGGGTAEELTCPYVCPYCKGCVETRHKMVTHLKTSHATEPDVEITELPRAVKTYERAKQKPKVEVKTYIITVGTQRLKTYERKKAKAVITTELERAKPKLEAETPEDTSQFEYVSLDNIKVEPCVKQEMQESRSPSPTEVNPLDLTECSKAFRSAYVLDKHSRPHPKTGEHSCPECDKTYKSKQRLKEHMRVHGTQRYVCTECNKEFHLKRSFMRHKVSHSKDRPFSCDLCNEKFKWKMSLKVHKKCMHENVEKTFVCDICGHASKYKANLIKHCRIHMTDLQFHCVPCDKKFVKRDHYEEHVRGVHQGQELPCEVCGKVFTMKHKLAAHARRHDSDFKNRFPCKVCGKLFPLKCELKKHMRRHFGEVNCICDICGKTLTDPKNLETHIRTHTGEKPHLCDCCDKTFNAKGSLLVHLRTHTGDKPYSCKECGKQFSQKSPLVVHMRYHTGERPYKCTICTKDFVTKTLLSTHLKFHP